MDAGADPTEIHNIVRVELTKHFLMLMYDEGLLCIT